MLSGQTETHSIIQKIVNELVADHQPQRVILFGSYAYGNPRPDSDIDLLIVKDTSDRFSQRWNRVRRILSDPTHQTAIETLILTPDELAQRTTIRRLVSEAERLVLRHESYLRTIGAVS